MKIPVCYNQRSDRDGMGRLMISIVMAKARNDVIGNHNALPWRIPEDLRYFRRLTTGSSVVMGRQTFASIGRALAHRHNYVLTSDPAFAATDIHVIHSLQDMLAIPGNVFVIGGASLFRQALPLAKVLYLTDIHASFAGDASIHIDFSEWRLQTSAPGKPHQDCQIQYDFNVYVRKA